MATTIKLNLNGVNEIDLNLPGNAIAAIAAGKTSYTLTTSASDLTNGVTGSGAIVLQTSPTITSPIINNVKFSGTPQWQLSLESSQLVLRDNQAVDGWFFALPDINVNNTVCNIFGGATKGTNLMLQVNGRFEATSYSSIGGAPVSTVGFYVQGSPMTGANQFAVDINPTFDSTATTAATCLIIAPVTAAAAYTIPSLYGIYIGNGALGAGSSVTNYYGLYVLGGSTIGSTANYAIYVNGTNLSFFGGPIQVQGVATFNSTVGINSTFNIAALGTATSLSNFGSNNLALDASYWNGTSAQTDQWLLNETIGTGTTPANVLNFAHNGVSGNTGIRFFETANATAGANVNSPFFQATGKYWTGSANATDNWQWQPTLGTGANPTSTFALTHSGTPGALAIDFSVATLKTTNIQFITGASITTGTFNQTTAPIAVRGQTSGNSFEFGHANSAGYACMLGYETGTGNPFIGLGAVAGSTGNTYKTAGLLGQIIRSQVNATLPLLEFGHVASNNADNQTFVEDARITSTGIVQATTAFWVNGAQIAASNLSNGTTGTGPVVLSAGPTFNSGGIAIFNDVVKFAGNTSLPTATGSAIYFAGGFASPVAGKIYVGDGTGWEIDFAKRSASVDTTLFKFKDSGEFDGTNFILDSTGKFSQYNGLTTIGTGVGVLVAKADATAQAANIGTTALFTATNGGTYRVSAVCVLTQAATTSSTLPGIQINWTDSDTSAVNTQTVTGTSTANTVGTYGAQSGFINGVATIQVKAGTVINYDTTAYASSGATPMQYAIHIKLQYLGA